MSRKKPQKGEEKEEEEEEEDEEEEEETNSRANRLPATRYKREPQVRAIVAGRLFVSDRRFVAAAIDVSIRHTPIPISDSDWQKNKPKRKKKRKHRPLPAGSNSKRIFLVSSVVLVSKEVSKS